MFDINERIERIKSGPGAAGIGMILAHQGVVNEGRLAVGDDIMKIVVAGDIREHVFDGLQRLVGIVKREVVTEAELR